MEVLRKYREELENIKEELKRIRDNPHLLSVDDTASSTPITNKRNRYLRALETFWENINHCEPGPMFPPSDEKGPLFVVTQISTKINRKEVTRPFPSLRDGTAVRKQLCQIPFAEIDKTYRPTSPDELRQRLTILGRGIRLGQFDDILNDPPEKTITGIMGNTGELIQRIGVKPEEGSTYKELSSIEKNAVQGKRI
jgi:hypothetical protein